MNTLKQKALAVALVLGAGLSPLASAMPMVYNGAGGNVPPSGTSGLFSSTISVADTGDITSVSVSLNNFTHSWIGDINATLEFDDGSASIPYLAVLFGAVGPGSSDDAGGTYTFATGGLDGFERNPSTTSFTIPSGTYAPTGTYSTLIGLSAAGSWTLNLSDDFSGDSGSLRSWTLNLGMEEISPPPVSVPEPATLALFGLGLAGLGWSRRKKA
jgi:subtilisin-like proprotein convertase family protein